MPRDLEAEKSKLETKVSPITYEVSFAEPEEGAAAGTTLTSPDSVETRDYPDDETHVSDLQSKQATLDAMEPLTIQEPEEGAPAATTLTSPDSVEVDTRHYPDETHINQLHLYGQAMLPSDLGACVYLENLVFPPNEACSEDKVCLSSIIFKTNTCRAKPPMFSQRPCHFVTTASRSSN